MSKKKDKKVKKSAVPFNPYQKPENKQVGVFVVLDGHCGEVPRTAFPLGCRWKWQKIIGRYWLVVFHEEAGEHIVDAQYPAENVHYVLGPTCLIRDKEW